MNVFGERLRLAMKIRRMNQSMLANKTGIACGTISNYATGKYAPKDRNIDLIADALNVSKGFLRGYTNNPDRMEDPDLQSFLDEMDRHLQMSANPIELSAEDYSLLTAYQQADKKTQKAIRIMLGLE